ncbi:SDR family oxidoreductase [Arthrobacter agilis]|uniref:SDR family oxidoreductase n=1 Tax=Arthrobacter agilis TaxID=37921 RepID=UPI00277D47F6|nr:SDR family oxidoreductase [Arthrobacter agilis]MDQ0736527.1 NAD(P)-dependent dehydrogenase (short-subunit alcohol dehydrogenase family) [Arthrobacter agilis]
MVTGAGSGIGRAVAQQLHEVGFNVVLAGRTLTALQETATALKNTFCVPTDVTSQDDVAALFEAARTHWGRVDLLFNNAGITGPSAPLEDITTTEWQQVLQVNQTGSFLCAAEAIRTMKQQRPSGGRIINNGSIAAHSPRPHAAGYAMTKSAVTALTRSIDLEGRAFGITAGQIDIGNASTGMMGALGVESGALQADGTRMIEPTFDVCQAARAVTLMATMPAEANINQLTITASGMPFIGRG